MVGIVAPVLCLIADPVVFKGGDEHGGILARHWIFGYGFIALEVATLAAWLASRGRLGPLCGIAAGTLLTRAFFAAAMGLFLLPLSIVGLLLIIGLLGFTPWLTAYAYLHQGKLALDRARARAGWTRVAAGLCLGSLLAFGLPAWTQVRVQRAWREAVAAVADGDESARSRVAFWHCYMDNYPDYDPLSQAIDQEPDPVRKQRLERARD
jgi:hypothetical protein